MSRPVEKQVHELCLVCGGERWIRDPQEPSRSKACPYCDAQGWVDVAASSLGGTDKTVPKEDA